MRYTGHVQHVGEWRGIYRVLVRKPDGKRPLGIHSRRCEDNIKMDLQASIFLRVLYMYFHYFFIHFSRKLIGLESQWEYPSA